LSIGPAQARRDVIEGMLLERGAVTVRALQARFGVSAMTARRDLEALQHRGAARRTHGGAVLPFVSIHEDSFAERMGVATGEKIELAEAAAALVRPGESVFLDSSSSAFFVAQAIIERGVSVRVITNSGPAMHVLAECEHVDLFGVGGSLRRLTGSYVGPAAVETVRAHFADRAFFSVTGVTADGALTDADEREAAVKRAMVDNAAQPVLLLEASKLGIRGRHVIAPLGAVSTVITYEPKATSERRQ
jgi:DeoR/GlpR family transcriptional regulator of sugar metabolism